MGLRPGRCYREITQEPYCRSAAKVMKKAFVRGVPGIKIHNFDMGNLKGVYDTEVSLIIMEPKQLRHNCLEAARMAVNQVLEKAGIKEGFYFKVRVYPHHILRENPLASGAGADRFQTGMAKAFGKPIGRAARVKRGQKIFSIRLPRYAVNSAKEALRQADVKLSGTFRVIVEDISKPAKK